jgi:uncharacterized membrane protein
MPNPSQAPQKTSLPPIQAIEFDQPLKWLVMGWKDIARHPFWSLSHGVVMAAAGLVITVIAHDQFWLLVSAMTGFLVVAPVLATSLYAMSRADERQEKVDSALLIKTWTGWQLHARQDPAGYWSLIQFGLLLALAGTGWVLTSSALITLAASQPIHSPMDFIRYVMLAPEGYLFEIWLAVGGLLAAPIFASSVVSMPLLLDKRVTVLQAVMTSWKAVTTHPRILAFWAFLIMGFAALGLMSLFLGLVFVVPMLGHASWHAYKDLVDTHHLPDRLSFEGL